MFTDETRGSVWDSIRQCGLRAFDRLLTQEVFAEAEVRAGISVRSGPLNVVNRVWLGLAAALYATKTFAEVLSLTLKILEDSEAFARTPLKKRCQQLRNKRPRCATSSYDPHGKGPEVTEEAFCKARRTMPMSYWVALIVVLGERFQSQYPQSVYWRHFRLLALDGSVFQVPRSPTLAEYFGTAKNGTKIEVPQARMVMLQFPLIRLPYRYELVPLTDAETNVAERLTTHLQDGDLLLMDRGFWSYCLFCLILDRKAHFGIRLRAKTKLHTVRRLGKHDRVVRWKVPTGQRARQREEGLPDSLDLRLIDYRIPGFRPSAIVTSVTDPERLSREDWVRLTTETEPGDERLGVGLYHRRWEIETTFYEIKITLGMKKGLRSHRPEGISYEVAGYVLLYLLTRWLIYEAAVEHRVSDPLRISFSGASNELDDMWKSLVTSSPTWVANILLPRLLQRIAQHLVPLRPGRHDPRPNDTKAKNKGGGRYQPAAKLRTAKTKINSTKR